MSNNVEQRQKALKTALKTLKTNTSPVKSPSKKSQSPYEEVFNFLKNSIATQPNPIKEVLLLAPEAYPKSKLSMKVNYTIMALNFIGHSVNSKITRNNLYTYIYYFAFNSLNTLPDSAFKGINESFFEPLLKESESLEAMDCLEYVARILFPLKFILDVKALRLEDDHNRLAAVVLLEDYINNIIDGTPKVTRKNMKSCDACDAGDPERFELFLKSLTGITKKNKNDLNEAILGVLSAIENTEHIQMNKAAAKTIASLLKSILSGIKQKNEVK